jgi:hypothetical protein
MSTAEDTGLCPQTNIEMECCSMLSNSGHCICDKQPSLTYNKRKCVDWMSQIPEEVTPKVIRKSLSEAIFTFHPLERRDNLYPRSPNDQRKTFRKANSDLKGLLSSKEGFTLESEEEINKMICNKKEACERASSKLDSTTKQFIYNALNELDDEELVCMKQHFKSDETFNRPRPNDVNILNTKPACKESPEGSSFNLATKEEADLKNYKNNGAERLTIESIKDLRNYVGEIKISIQYLLVTERLKVTVQNVSALKQVGNCNIFVSVSLISQSGKSKRTKTKKHRDIINFDCDIFFKNTAADSVKYLYIKVYRKSALFSTRKNTCLGECTVNLDKLDLISKASISEKLLPC